MLSRIDHVGFVGPDLSALRNVFARLGFSPTMPQPLMRFEPSNQTLLPLDQSSCHIVFKRTYIELSAAHTTDPRQHLQAYSGGVDRLQIVAFASADVAATRDAVVSAGFGAKDLQWAAREVVYGERTGQARFHWFMVEPRDAPEGLVCFVRNTTPELIFQDIVQHHPLGAREVTGLAIVLPTTEAAAACAERYARYPAGRDPGITILTAADAEQRVGSAIRSARSAFAALAVEVEDLGRAAAVLAARSIAFETRPAGLVVSPADAGGAALCLHPPGRVFF